MKANFVKESNTVVTLGDRVKLCYPDKLPQYGYVCAIFHKGLMRNKHLTAFAYGEDFEHKRDMKLPSTMILIEKDNGTLVVSWENCFDPNHPVYCCKVVKRSII